jgi:aspartokinase
MRASGSLLESLHSIVVGDEKAQAMAVKNDLAFVRVKGVGLEDTPGVVSDLTKALNSEAINIYGIFTITSSVVVFVDLKDEKKTVQLLKQTLEKNHNGQTKAP